MTKVTYVLSNGVEVNTYREAEGSGLRYKTRYSLIPEPTAQMSQKRKEFRAVTH